MKFTVAELAHLLKIEKDLIKTWSYKFSSYLSPKANPGKGNSREFNVDDIRVFAFILMYWEDEPDIEYIKICLNSNSHYDHEMIDNLLTEITPAFIESPNNMDESWKHGVLFNGLAEFSDTFYLANSYKLAGDRLIEIALKNEEAWELFCPAVYNYRHATELYMKAITGYNKKSHDLISLFNKLQELLKSEFNTKIPYWFNNLISTFNNFDPGGTTFRYGKTLDTDEIFIDLVQLKTLMEWVEQSFKNIRKHQGLPDVA